MVGSEIPRAPARKHVGLWPFSGAWCLQSNQNPRAVLSTPYATVLWARQSTKYSIGLPHPGITSQRDVTDPLLIFKHNGQVPYMTASVSSFLASISSSIQGTVGLDKLPGMRGAGAFQQDG